MTIHVIFTNYSKEFNTAKQARAWVRSQGLTVRDAEKVDSNYHFDIDFTEDSPETPDSTEENDIPAEDQKLTARETLMTWSRDDLAQTLQDESDMDSVPKSWTKSKIIDALDKAIMIEALLS